MSSNVRCRPRNRPGWLIVSLSLALVAVACGNTSSGVDEAASPVATDSSDRNRAESVIVQTADGGQLDWGSLDGQDVVLWFWAPW